MATLAEISPPINSHVDSLPDFFAAPERLHRPRVEPLAWAYMQDVAEHWDALRPSLGSSEDVERTNLSGRPNAVLETATRTHNYGAMVAVCPSGGAHRRELENDAPGCPDISDRVLCERYVRAITHRGRAGGLSESDERYIHEYTQARSLTTNWFYRVEGQTHALALSAAERAALTSVPGRWTAYRERFVAMLRDVLRLRKLSLFGKAFDIAAQLGCCVREFWRVVAWAEERGLCTRIRSYRNSLEHSKRPVDQGPNAYLPGPVMLRVRDMWSHDAEVRESWHRNAGEKAQKRQASARARMMFKRLAEKARWYGVLPPLPRGLPIEFGEWLWIRGRAVARVLAALVERDDTIDRSLDRTTELARAFMAGEIGKDGVESMLAAQETNRERLSAEIEALGSMSVGNAAEIAPSVVALARLVTAADQGDDVALETVDDLGARDAWAAGAEWNEWLVVLGDGEAAANDATMQPGNSAPEQLDNSASPQPGNSAPEQLDNSASPQPGNSAPEQLDDSTSPQQLSEPSPPCVQGPRDMAEPHPEIIVPDPSWLPDEPDSPRPPWYDAEPNEPATGDSGADGRGTMAAECAEVSGSAVADLRGLGTGLREPEHDGATSTPEMDDVESNWGDKTACHPGIPENSRKTRKPLVHPSRSPKAGPVPDPRRSATAEPETSAHSAAIVPRPSAPESPNTHASVPHPSHDPAPPPNSRDDASYRERRPLGPGRSPKRVSHDTARSKRNRSEPSNVRNVKLDAQREVERMYQDAAKRGNEFAARWLETLRRQK